MVIRFPGRWRGPALVLLAVPLWPLASAVVSARNSIDPAGIVVHHSTMPASLSGVTGPYDAAVLARAHADRGFGTFYRGMRYTIGYHYVILPDGTVQPGRPEHCKGAHTKGYPSYLGICLIGDFSSRDNPNGQRGPVAPTMRQMQVLTELCSRLANTYRIPAGRIFVHHDLNSKTQCPGDRFPLTDFHALIRKSLPLVQLGKTGGN